MSPEKYCVLCSERDILFMGNIMDCLTYIDNHTNWAEVWRCEVSYGMVCLESIAIRNLAELV